MTFSKLAFFCHQFFCQEMPITLQSELRRISQEEFGQIAYHVMEVVFAVHNELGRFLEEDICRAAIAQRLGNAQAGFAVKVEFDSFQEPRFTIRCGSRACEGERQKN
jgi:hypothetical protein